MDGTSLRKNFSAAARLDDRGNGIMEGEEPFIRRRRTTSNIFESGHADSPLHDLPMLAISGVSTRVMLRRVTSSSKLSMSQLFSDSDCTEHEDMVLITYEFTKPLIVAAGLACINSFQFGYHNGNMNTQAEVMRAKIGIPADNPENDNIWGFCVSIFCVAALFACNICGRVVDQQGRRQFLLNNTLLFLVGSILEATSYLVGCEEDKCQMGLSLAVVLLILGRMVSGFASGGTTVVVPMYLGEIAPPQLRGALGTAFQLTMVTAMLIAQVAGLPFAWGTADCWPLVMLIPVLPSGLLLMLQSQLLESPKWLASQPTGYEQALQTLSQLRQVDENECIDELDFIAGAAEFGRSLSTDLSSFDDFTIHSPQTYGILAVLSDRSIRKPLQVAVVTMVVQQFSGINNAFNFSCIFLSQNGISMEVVTLIAVLMNVANVLVTVMVVYLMDAAGRRALLLTSITCMVVATGMLTVALTNPGQEWTAPLSVVSVVSFVMGFGIGLGPIPWLLPAEIFPIEKTATAAGCAASMNWLANMIVAQAFLPISNTLGGYSFVPFGVVLVSYFFYAYTAVPETRGKHLEEIQAFFK